uniref:Tail tape measure n=1 Tax=Salmonella phage vB_SE130_2P TaxID=3236707 RepID=A0AB39C574_9VIRU
MAGFWDKSLTSAEAGTKDLEAAQEQLKSTFQQTSSGTFELTDGLIQLTQISREAAETQLALAKANADIIAQQTAKAIQEDAKSWETWKASTSAAISQYDALVAK